MADTITASSAELPVRDEVAGVVDAVTATNTDAPATTTEEPATEPAPPQPTVEGKKRLHLIV